MKSQRVIYILFLLFCVNINAKTYIGIEPVIYSQVQVDSLYSSYSQSEVNKKNAEAVVHWYEEEQKKNIKLSNEDIKKLAVSYALLKDESNAVEYAEKYIKKSHTIDIVDNVAFESIKNSKKYQSLVSSYKPKVDTWILFFIASGIIGIFIAIVINLRKKGDILANLLIGLFVLFHSLFILHLSLYFTNYVFKLPHSFWATITFSFLYGPLLYFYFRRISEKYVFKWLDIIHLVPTLAIIFYFIPIYNLPTETKFDRLFNVDQNFASTLNVIVVIKASSLLIYSLLVYKIYLKNVKKSVTKTSPEIIKWQRNMSILNMTYAFTYTFYAFILATKVVFMRDNNFMLYSQVILLACIVLYVGYTAYVQPRVFSKKYLFIDDDQQLKYQKSGMTESLSNELKKQLLLLLNEEKIYKTNNINLEMLAERLGTTRHNISQVINEHFDVNFFNLINKYRIKEAQQIFRKDSHNNLNIIDVAYDVGFNNKVTFNKAFKEETKLTPTQFLRSISSSDLVTSA